MAATDGLEETNKESSGTKWRAESPANFTVIEAGNPWRIIDWMEIVAYKDLLRFLVLRDITVLYKQTVLGASWAIILPVCSTVVFSIIFGKLLGVSSDGLPYPLFAFAALLPWNYFSNALQGATNSLVGGSNLITRVYFPRVFVPVVPVLSKLLDFAISCALLLCMMVWYEVEPTVNLIWVPVPMVLLVMTTAGLGIGLSALAIQFRDVRHAMGFILTLLQYAAPVVWPASKLPVEMRFWYGFYPMGGVIEGFRACLLGGGPMPWDLLIPGYVTGVAVLLCGAIYFRKMESSFADVA